MTDKEFEQFIDFLVLFMNASRKKQIQILNKLERSREKCSK